MLNKTGVPEIKTAVNFLHQMSADEKMREKKSSIDFTKRMDECFRECFKKYSEEHPEVCLIKGFEDGFEEGFKEGFRIGFEEGIEKHKNELITKWRNKGYTEEQIQELLD